MQRGGYVYILTNRFNRVLYTGVTARLGVRLQEHVEKANPQSFTSKYNVDKLVYYQGFGLIEDAIAFEKYVKGKSRSFKDNLINEFNPNWKSLNEEIYDWI